MDTSKIQHMPKFVPAGERAVKESIMRAAENGAIPEDVRAARAGLITHITPHAGKRTATIARSVPDVSALLERERAEREHKRAMQKYMREEYERIMRGQ